MTRMKSLQQILAQTNEIRKKKLENSPEFFEKLFQESIISTAIQATNAEKLPAPVQVIEVTKPVIENPLVRWGKFVHLVPDPKKPNHSSLKVLLRVLTEQACENPELLIKIPVAEIIKQTSLAHNTVYKCLKYLKKHRYIEDSSIRVGHTMSIIVYRILMANHPVNGFACEPGTLATVQVSPLPIKDIKARMQREFFEVFFQTFAKQKYNEDRNLDKEARRQAKRAAWQWWKKTDPDELLIQRIMAASDQHKKSCEKYNKPDVLRSHPLTWLKRKIWENDLEFAKPNKRANC